MYTGTSTLSRVGDDEYNLLIQNEKGRVLLFKQGIPFREAVAEIENRMFLKEEEDAEIHFLDEFTVEGLLEIPFYRSNRFDRAEEGKR